MEWRGDEATGRRGREEGRGNLNKYVLHNPFPVSGVNCRQHGHDGAPPLGICEEFYPTVIY